MNYPKFESGIQPATRDALASVYRSLPIIRGRWVVVDPNGTHKVEHAVSDLETAYGLCVDERGDGILIMSSGNTSAETTSYLETPIEWAKNGITVVGVGAPISMYQRARVANKDNAYTASTISFDAADGPVYYIKDSANGFITAGFEAGMKIDVNTASTATNDGQYTIEEVAAGVLTVTEAVTDEAAATAGETTITSYVPYLVNVSGANNAFYNVSFGNWSAIASAVGGVKVSGVRNYFSNVHFVGAGNATPGATTGAYDVLLDGVEEITFDRCTFGTDSVAKEAANGEVLIDGSSWRIRFNECDFVSQSETAGKGAVKSADAASFQGIIAFRGCQFLNWNNLGIGAIDDVFIGTAPASGAYSVTPDSTCVGFTGWGANVYVAGAAAAATAGGQIATKEA